MQSIIKLYKINLLLVVMGLTGLISVVWLLRGEITKWMISYKLLAQPENLTELYFPHHRQLPSRIASGSAFQKFEFTIRNLENETRTYPYYVYAVSTVSAQFLQRGEVSLNHGEKKTTEIVFRLNNGKNRTKIETGMYGPVQTIHFWINP